MEAAGSKPTRGPNAEQRMSMSLEDIVKSTKKNTERKPKPKKAGGDANAKKPAKLAKSEAKLAAVEGQGRAKRQAKFNQRRGIRMSDKPTAEETKTQVARQEGKRIKKKENASKPKVKKTRGNDNNSRADNVKDLKISFGRKELSSSHGDAQFAAGMRKQSNSIKKKN